jgi:hypothetical protein
MASSMPNCIPGSFTLQNPKKQAASNSTLYLYTLYVGTTIQIRGAGYADMLYNL